MQRAFSRRNARATVIGALFLMLLPWPAAALDLFAGHQVTVQFASQDGKPLAGAEVRVFAPGGPNRPALTGHTDSQGKFEFSADTDGFWSAEARSGAEIARVMVRVGAASQPGQEPEQLSPYLVLGGLFLLLVLAFAVRVARARLRRPRG